MSAVADSETSKLLRLLADLGADAKQTRKFLTLFDGKPSPPIIAPEASGVVFSEGMAKKNKRGEGPYIYRLATPAPCGQGCHSQGHDLSGRVLS